MEAQLPKYQQALRASEARFRNVIEKNADGVLVVRPGGVIGFVNPAAEALLGRHAGDLVGELLGQLIVPSGTAEVDLPCGGTPRVAELRVVETEWEGEPALLATLHDVTERKQALDALRFLADASTELAGSLDVPTTLASVARLAVGHLADWCLVDLLEPEHTLRRAAAHRDPDRQALAERLCGGGLTPPRRPHGLQEVLHTGRPEVRAEADDACLEALAADGGQLRVLRELGCKSLMIVPLKARHRTLGAVTFAAAAGRSYGPADRTLAEELACRAALAVDNARLYDEAQEAVRRRDEFLAMLAHELRNPLAPILSAAHLLRLQGPADGSVARVRDVVERQARHMSRLLDDLLDISRVTRGKIGLRREAIDLAAVVADAVQTSRPLLEARGHRLSVALPPEPVRLDADPTRLAQVLANLLNNAAKYTPSGGHVELTVRREADEVAIRVRDDGVGIAPEMLPRIFEPFTQLEQSLDRADGGLGIGLTLVRNLVELHGGRVVATSDGPGRGSEFLVALPLPAVERPACPPPAATPVQAARHVLLIEDNDDGREMLCDLLRLWGHRVETAEDGRRGIELARARRPDVVLLDIGLPGMDGYRVARQLRAGPGGKEMCLIAVTGYGQPADRRKAKEAGFDNHLVKPVDLKELARLLGSHASPAAPAQPGDFPERDDFQIRPGSGPALRPGS